ncbi:MAG: class I adenylate-forming enzyme family protein [Chloroflexota bacterium]
MSLPFRNMRDVLGLHAKVSSRKVAVISFDTDFKRQELSYLEFVGKAHQVANFLYEDLEIERGDTIAILSPTHENALLLYFATWVIGASIVALDSEANAETIQSCLSDSGATILFADHSFIEMTSSWVAEIDTLDGVIQIGGERREGYLRFEDLASNRPTTFLGDESGAKGADIPMTGGNERTARLTDTALIRYVNGHKITQTQGDLLHEANQLAQLTALTGNQVTISTLPIHEHMAQVIVAPLIMGGTVILFEHFSADNFWNVLVAERAHAAILNAKHIKQMVTTAQTHLTNGKMRFGGKIIQQDIKHFRHITVIDNNLTVNDASDFEDIFGIPIVTGAKHPKTDALLTLMPITLSWKHHQEWLYGGNALSVGCPVVPLAIDDDLITQITDDDTHQPTGLTGYIKKDDSGQSFVYLT